MISRLGETAPSMLRTPETRVPKIFSRQIYGTRSTVKISSSTNGPDPLSHFKLISHFTTSRLGQTTPSILRTPETRVPKIFSHQINGDQIDGPDHLEHQWSRSSLAFRDFVNLGSNNLRAPDSRLSRSLNQLPTDVLLRSLLSF
jgi:hypothetical protein